MTDNAAGLAISGTAAELDAIMGDLDVTGAAWEAAGYPDSRLRLGGVMDPNEALYELRAAVHEARKLDSGGDDPLETLAALIADRVEALDGWLSKGGFLPSAWGERGKCAARLTDQTGPYTHHYVCTKPPKHGGMHEDETRHGAPRAKWHDPEWS